jgi:hypothetical protein
MQSSGISCCENERVCRVVVIASEAKQSRAAREILDCFVAEPVIGPRYARTRWLLAMTKDLAI